MLQGEKCRAQFKPVPRDFFHLGILLQTYSPCTRRFIFFWHKTGWSENRTYAKRSWRGRERKCWAEWLKRDSYLCETKYDKVMWKFTKEKTLSDKREIPFRQKEDTRVYMCVYVYIYIYTHMYMLPQTYTFHAHHEYLYHSKACNA